MSILVELMTTPEVMSHLYLPWQKMFGQTLHHPWQSPKWCSLTLPLDDPTAALPYWATVWARHEMVGMVPLRRRKSSGNPDWELDLRLLHGGGIVGHQATAVLNAVISQLSVSQGKPRNWTLSYDPTDRFLCERFELAFQQRHLVPRQAHPEIYGWHLEFGKPGHDIPASVSDHPMEWYDNGWAGCGAQAAPNLDSLLEFAEDLEQLHLLNTESGHQLAYWKIPMAADPARGSSTRDASVRLPWAVLGDSSPLSPLQLLDALERVGGRWVLPNRLLAHLEMDSVSHSMPVWLPGRRVDAHPWLAHVRRFTRPSIWDQFRSTLRRPSSPSQHELAR